MACKELACKGVSNNVIIGAEGRLCEDWIIVAAIVAAKKN